MSDRCRAYMREYMRRRTRQRRQEVLAELGGKCGRGSARFDLGPVGASR
jgi:hypothetical protein